MPASPLGMTKALGPQVRPGQPDDRSPSAGCRGEGMPWTRENPQPRAAGARGQGCSAVGLFSAKLP